LSEGAVRFDWVGTYLQTDFTGGRISIEAAETGTSYYNVFIDGILKNKIKITGKDKQIVNIASGLTKSTHRLMLQKCTEGEYGCTTIFKYLLAPTGTMKAVPHKSRMIEIYGDSYTCGYGSESAKASDPFKLETENCNKAYGCIIARYFNADYALIAHSGRGMVRNWGDTVRLSKNTMFTRQNHMYDDFDGTTIYDFKAYKPNIILINLGTNDFSQGAVPTETEFVNGYIKMIQKIRSCYGNVPILCIIAHSAEAELLKYITELKQRVKDDNLYISNPMNDIVTVKDDMGASWHPNYSGHKKIAMTLIPRISAILGWPIENEIIK
jgi:lysophospholipase L1-like esterase